MRVAIVGGGQLNHLPDGPEKRARDIELAAQDPLGHGAWLYEHDAERELAPPAAVAATADSSRMATAGMRPAASQAGS